MNKEEKQEGRKGRKWEGDGKCPWDNSVLTWCILKTLCNREVTHVGNYKLDSQFHVITVLSTNQARNAFIEKALGLEAGDLLQTRG